MNSANETLRAIRHRKALLKKEKEESIAWIESKYKEDIAILDEEEREWLEQFNDVPVDEIYKNTENKEVKK